MRFLSLALLGLLSLAAAPSVRSEIYFQESFDDKTWTDRWVHSSAKKSEQGTWGLRTSDWYGDKQRDQGLATTQDARFYFLTSKLDKPFNNKGKDLVLQFSVKHPQKIDCGGGYIKVLPSNTDQENFNGDSPYNIMFGPDICGTTKRVHVIFSYKGENKLIKKEIPCETDQLTHVYTLIVHPDQTYEVRVDGTKKESGSLLDDWDFLPAKTIKDPNVSKPADWVDEAQIDDPEDKKPEGYDDVPKQIPDPEATKPDDWDDEADGEWEAPQIDNPEYKGEWKPKKIPNPAYKGKWVHPEIPNPAYVEDNEIYVKDNAFVGFDLWQVKSGTIFDNIIISDSVTEAEKVLADTYTASKSKEKEMFDAAEKARVEKEEAERKKAQEEAEKAKKASEAEDDEDEEEDEEDDKSKGKKAHDEL